jgi:orotidine-5'-phosphate decarboxylase
MRMSHPLVLALFDDAAAAAQAARALRVLGVARERVSIVARTHDEEGAVAAAADASPGSEIEDSAPASRLGELGAHVLSAMALVMPGIGPIVADGPLAAGLGEAAGHLAGGVARTLTRAGLPEAEADRWERRIEAGAFLLGAHTDDRVAGSVRDAMERNGATAVALGSWIDR